MSPESFVRLGWSFFKTVLRSLFPRRSQLARFESQYRPDGMLSARPEDPAVQQGAARCIGCGLCDAVALERDAFDALGPDGPMAFVSGVSRQAGIDLRVTDAATPELLDALTARCPVKVPFTPLLALVRRRHAEFAAARGLPAPAPTRT